MDSKRIIELIRYPEDATPGEVEELLALSRQYSYSPVFKTINAKLASIKQSAEKEKFITTAAIASVDRANLKKYILSDTWEISTAAPEKKEEKEPEDNDGQVSTVTDDTVVKENEPFSETNEVREIEAEKIDNDNPEEETGSHDSAAGVESKPPDDKKQEKETDWIWKTKVGTSDDKDTEDSRDSGKPAENEAQISSGEQITSPDSPDDKGVAELSGQPESQTPEKPAEEPGKIEGSDKKGNTAPTGQKKKQHEKDATPELSEKKFDAIPPDHEGNVSAEENQLSSDILKNIQEYRKNRDFFEKILGNADPGENKESDELKKKPGKKPGKKSGKKSSAKDTDDLHVKKNAEKSGQKIKQKKKEQPSESKMSGAGQEEKGTVKNEKQTKSENENDGSAGQPAPVEIPDRDLLKKETEDKISEGYQVYEEEDPEVIREFLEKISENAGDPEPESARKLKKEEQVELIENFIRSEPRIKNVKEAKKLKDREDLSLPSVKFKDDIISENLANIMKHQGKTDQAIDIYKKLIWKFPQKKTYFAAQIEELKKKIGK